MEINFFKLIEDTIAQVLNTVNKGVTTEIKKRIREKNSQIKKLGKMVNARKDMSFSIDNSIFKMISVTKLL